MIGRKASRRFASRMRRSFDSKKLHLSAEQAYFFLSDEPPRVTRTSTFAHSPGGKSVEAASSVYASKPAMRAFSAAIVLASACDPSTIRSGAGSLSTLAMIAAAMRRVAGHQAIVRVEHREEGMRRVAVVDGAEFGDLCAAVAKFRAGAARLDPRGFSLLSGARTGLTATWLCTIRDDRFQVVTYSPRLVDQWHVRGVANTSPTLERSHLSCALPHTGRSVPPVLCQRPDPRACRLVGPLRIRHLFVLPRKRSYQPQV